MPTREPSDAGQSSSDVTSAGVPWSEVPDDVLAYVEWMDGRHGSAKEPLPPIDEVPIPTVLFELPRLHENRPRGSKAMIDVTGARRRLADCGPGAWLVSPYTGWRWAKWPNGEVGWVPDGVALPNTLRVSSRVFANRATPAPSAANAPLRQRFCVDIILAAIDRRTGEPGDLRYNRETAPTSSPHLPRRKQSPPPLVELRADRFPSLPNRVLVDHTTDLRPFTQHRNPRHPSHSDAQRRIAIQLLFGVS